MEKQIEAYLVKSVRRIGGVAYKFTSPAHRGVADRVVCLPGGRVVMVELKAPNGRLSPLQKVFAEDMQRLGIAYECLWSKEQVDGFIARVS